MWITGVIRKIRTWLGFRQDLKWLSLELFLELSRARFQVSFVPFRVYARDLGTPIKPTDHTDECNPDISAETVHLLGAVRSLTTGWSTVLPWKCTCLVQALAAYRVLRRRGCRPCLYLGLRKSPSDLEAHAWLVYGSRFITGRAQAETFAPVALFKGASA